MIVVQARTGATRLPGKMSRSFSRNKTILELIVEELLSEFEPSAVVVATSMNPGDDCIEALAQSCDVACSRGSEEDVLDRVWRAVCVQKPRHVVRVCADNPFLRSGFISALLSEADVHKDVDYLSFEIPDGTPSILSHVGLFAEVVRLETLEQIHRTASSKRHREHLTSHVLDHADQYQRRFLPVPEYIAELADLRLTVDTESDFLVCQELYDLVCNRVGPRFSAEQLVSIVGERPDLLERMSQQIAANAKQ